MTESVLVEELVNELRLEVLSGLDYLDRIIVTSDVSRPGLELTGYFNYYSHDRIQLLGRKEITFAQQMTEDERRMVMKRLCTKDMPVFVIARELEAPKELLEAANAAQIPVLRSVLSTSRISSVITNYLEAKLAERLSIHGVFVDVYGLGVLIQGDSGIGKSETGLELIKKGHRLIADDRVDVFREDENTLIGEAPRILEHVMEIRGIGIIDVMNLFGASAVRKRAQVQLVVYLENWNKETNFDRLGGSPEMVRMANVDVPKITIPVKTGRNVAIIIEVAAMNFRAKTMGYDATKNFEEKLRNLIEDNSDTK